VEHRQRSRLESFREEQGGSKFYDEGERGKGALLLRPSAWRGQKNNGRTGEETVFTRGDVKKMRSV